MTKNIDQLIVNLSSEPKPARKAQHPAVLFITWFIGACIYVGLLVALHYTPRPDLAHKLMQPLFLGEFVTLILLSATTSLSATILSFPDLYQKRWIALLPIAVFALFVLVIFLEWLGDRMPMPQHGMDCCAEITLAAMPPALWMFARIRRMAPVHPQLAGSCAVLSSFSIGALVLRIAEPTDSIPHLIVWHYLPMIGIGIMGLWLGRKIFKW